MIGKEACQRIKVVTCDQHRGYAESVRQYCANASLVWDKFHLVQAFNEALNEERKKEWDKYGEPSLKEDDLLAGKYKYIYLTKSANRSKTDRRHIEEVMKKNERIAKMELIKEHFHKMFHCQDKLEAQIMLSECYEWAWQAKAFHLLKWIMSVRERNEFWNYFEHRLTSGVSEGINRAIKTLKWMAYGYKDMNYFALKIMQRYGYLNHKYALQWMYQKETNA
jgi:transposase